MQRAKLKQVMEKDMKQVVSNVKRDQFMKAISETRDPLAMEDVKRRIRVDPQLSEGDRIQLLSKAEHLDARMG